MKKTYWWRVAILLLSLGLFLHWFVGIRMYDIGIYNDYTKPIANLSLAYATVSVLLFFVSDIVFKKWLGFAVAWFLVTFLWIANAPTYDSGFFSMMNFTKGVVARMMSILFVPISLGILLFASWKERKSKAR